MRSFGLFFALLLLLAGGARAQDPGGERGVDNTVQRRWQSRLFGGRVDTEVRTTPGDLRQAGTVRIKLPAMRKGKDVGVWRDVVAFEASSSTADGAAVRLEALGEVLAENAAPDLAVIDRNPLQVSGRYRCNYEIEGHLRIELRGVYTVFGSVRLEADADAGIVDVDLELQAFVTITARTVLALPGEPEMTVRTSLSGSELELCHVVIDSRIGGADEPAVLRFEPVAAKRIILRVGDGAHRETLAAFTLPDEQIDLLDPNLMEIEQSLLDTDDLPHDAEGALSDDRLRDLGESVLDKLEGAGGPDLDGMDGKLDIPDLGGMDGKLDIPGLGGNADLLGLDGMKESEGLGPRGPDGGLLDLGEGPGGILDILTVDGLLGGPPSLGGDDDYVPDLQPGAAGADPRLFEGGGGYNVVADAIGGAGYQQSTGEGGLSDGLDLGTAMADDLAEKAIADLPDQGSDRLNAIMADIIRQEMNPDAKASSETQEAAEEFGDGSIPEDLVDHLNSQDPSEGGDEDDSSSASNSSSGGDSSSRVTHGSRPWGPNLTTFVAIITSVTPNPDGGAAPPKLTEEQLFALSQAINRWTQGTLINPGPEPVAEHHLDDETIDAMSDPDAIREKAQSPYITPNPDGDPAGGSESGEDSADEDIESLIQPPDPDGLDNTPTGPKLGKDTPPDGGDPQADD